nr:hypothetical protein GCM10017745_46690 [Saccharothrix mutabilis subsp. capreolus]
MAALTPGPGPNERNISMPALPDYHFDHAQRLDHRCQARASRTATVTKPGADRATVVLRRHS